MNRNLIRVVLRGAILPDSLRYPFEHAPAVLSSSQVYDFPSLAAYTNYSTCVSQQPGRTVSQAFEVWKVSE
jgi:hypothetical protein